MSRKASSDVAFAFISQLCGVHGRTQKRARGTLAHVTIQMLRFPKKMRLCKTCVQLPMDVYE